MKLVTWNCVRELKCSRCNTQIEKGQKAWRVGGGKYRHAGAIRYFCLKCGEEIQQ